MTADDCDQGTETGVRGGQPALLSWARNPALAGNPNVGRTNEEGQWFGQQRRLPWPRLCSLAEVGRRKLRMALVRQPPSA